MIKVDIKKATAATVAIEARVRAGAQIQAQIASSMMQEDAQNEAPWENRTGNARQSIRGVSKIDGDKVYVGVSGGMDYSPYLEFCNEKKYAILYPTILKWKDRVLKSFSKIIG